MCTTLSEKWASAGKWNGREHGVWEQREMKRMIANIVWTETESAAAAALAIAC